MQLIRRAFSQPLHFRTSALCLAIIALNLLDGFATVRHLEFGAEELNPLMAALLRRGVSHFLIVKHLLASVGVCGIALNPEERISQWALLILLPLFILLAIYQIGLFLILF